MGRLLSLEGGVGKESGKASLAGQGHMSMREHGEKQRKGYKWGDKANTSHAHVVFAGAWSWMDVRICGHQCNVCVHQCIHKAL
jgi:hypothetical protein